LLSIVLVLMLGRFVWLHFYPVDICDWMNGGCSWHATCRMTDNVRYCTCFDGFTGNGVQCEQCKDQCDRCTAGYVLKDDHCIERSREQRQSVVVVVSSWRDDLSWLEGIPYPTFVYSEHNQAWLNGHHHTEAARFMHYLCSYYHFLPDYMFFLHGHRSSRHRPLDLINQISSVQLHPAIYKGFATYNMGLRGPREKRVYITMNLFWDQVMQKHFDGNFDARHGEKQNGKACCAEFVVSAQQVWRNPQVLYCDALHWLLSPNQGTELAAVTDNIDKLKGQALEWLYPFIFEHEGDSLSIKGE